MKTRKWKLDSDKTALLVIDMQNDFVRENAIMEVPHARQQVGRIAELIAACRSIGVPVFYTVHETNPALNPMEIASFPHLIDSGMRAGTDGIKVVDELAPAEDEYVVQKRRYSGFYQTDLDMALRNFKTGSGDNIDTLIVCGTVSNICCEATSRDAYYRDYKVIFGSDINSAINKVAHDATVANMELFGQVMTAAEIIDELKG